MKDLQIIRARINYLGVMGVIAVAGAVVLVVLGREVEAMSIFALATTVVGIMGGAPRSAAPPDDPPSVPPSATTPPPAPVPVEQVTTDNLATWIASADRWGPDDLEAH